MFSVFTEELLTGPFTEQMFHFFIPALADPRHAFPFEGFLASLRGTLLTSELAKMQAPWLFYFVLAVGEENIGKAKSPLEGAGGCQLKVTGTLNCPGKVAFILGLQLYQLY